MSAIFAICVGHFSVAQADDYKVSTTEVAYPTKNIASKFMARVYADLGHNLSIQEYPQGRALIEANAGNVDGELFRGAGISSEYKNLIQIPGPISFSHITAYVKKGSHHSPEKWTDLVGLRVGYVIGAKIVEVKLRGIQSIAVQRPEQLFYMLENDRLDVAIYVVTRAEIPEGIVPVDTPLLIVPVYHYIHVKNKHLVVPLQDSIRRLTEQGELARIISKANTYPENSTFNSLPGE